MLVAHRSMCTVHRVHRVGPEASWASLEEKPLEPAQLAPRGAPTLRAAHPTRPSLSSPLQALPQDGEASGGSQQEPRLLDRGRQAEAQFANHLMSASWRDLKSSFSQSLSFRLVLHVIKAIFCLRVSTGVFAGPDPGSEVQTHCAFLKRQEKAAVEVGGRREGLC